MAGGLAAYLSLVELLASLVAFGFGSPLLLRELELKLGGRRFSNILNYLDFFVGTKKSPFQKCVQTIFRIGAK